MPSSRAVRVILSANCASEPPSPSATTTAASFADLEIIAKIAFSSEMVEFSFSPMRERGMPAAFLETVSS